MIARTATIAAALALTAGSVIPAAAADPKAGKQEEQAAKDDSKKPQKICIVENIIGSRVPMKTCMTRKEWIKETGIDPLENR
ncbi:hypothetical protein ACFQ1E_05000 [Sphingomonas canadensis]|uniref:Uncharacterized protein n=1 Tax=Sphingomonas canadensis TaxID=1219257 RepID=A0ABW3H3B4_9SPHN|nr:hypothetical protein [Sphingomonas canadensis]MCW3835854.1 hypothetical protein [Sphingomonas canadensis]